MAKLADSESQYPHLYHQAEKIEHTRMSKDLLYRVIMEPHTTELNKAVMDIIPAGLLAFVLNAIMAKK